MQPLISMAKSPGAGYQTNQVNEAMSCYLLCLVPRPHFSSWPERFGSRGPCENVRAFPALSPRIRHRNELTERDWENAVQGLGNYLLSF